MIAVAASDGSGWLRSVSRVLRVTGAGRAPESLDGLRLRADRHLRHAEQHLRAPETAGG